VDFDVLKLSVPLFKQQFKCIELDMNGVIFFQILYLLVY